MSDEHATYDLRALVGPAGECPNGGLSVVHRRSGWWVACEWPERPFDSAITFDTDCHRCQVALGALSMFDPAQVLESTVEQRRRDWPRSVTASEAVRRCIEEGSMVLASMQHGRFAAAGIGDDR